MIRCTDAISFLSSLPKGCVDLIVTDPPYDIANTKPGGNSKLAKSMTGYNNDLVKLGIDKCEGIEWCEYVKHIQGGRINCYIFCNKKQIPMYFKYFVDVLKCSFDIIIWHKPNTPPTFYNKWMSDKEYCLYFRKSAHCMPENYADASTVFTHPTNGKDKKLFGHPTVKPLELIERIVRNSSKPGQMVIDPFLGSGTSGVAAVGQGRNFMGCDIDPKFVAIAQARVIDKLVNRE